MDVLLTGATGYIGSAVADALQVAGHQVIGLARSVPAANRLEALGIRSYRGDLAQPESIAQAARDAGGVIHTASTGNADAPEIDRRAVEAILTALEGTQKPFVYTSGVWVLGNTGDQVADEESPLAPTPLAAWRTAVEEQVLTAAQRGVRSVVIRPAIVYGRGGGLVAMLVRSAREHGAARYIGTGENRWPLVHVDDLANLYRLALERGPAGSLFIAASGPAIRLREIAEAASLAAGVGGRTQAWPIEEARQELGPLADALALDQQVTGAKATRVLGWTPRAPTLWEEMEYSYTPR
jgi:nucleoside-diphosphate-sugar epimerase